MLPRAVIEAFGWEPVPGAYNAYPQTARVLLTERGPDGERLQLWYADASHDGWCVSFGSAVRRHSGAAFGARPPDREGIGAGGCAGIEQPYWSRFGAVSTGSGNTFVVHVPGAARVRIELSDGRRRPLPIGEHWTAGWLSHRELALHPRLVGFAGDGHEIGSVPIG